MITKPIQRRLGGVGIALLLAAPLGAVSATQTSAQIPGMPAGAIPGLPAGAIPGMPSASYELTTELVMAWAESFPTIVAAMDELEVNVPEGSDAASMLAAMAIAGGANAQLNAVVAPYGFTDYGQWTAVTSSIMSAFSVLQAPAEVRSLILNTYQQTQANLDVVEANLDLVQSAMEAM